MMFGALDPLAGRVFETPGLEVVGMLPLVPSATMCKKVYLIGGVVKLVPLIQNAQNNLYLELFLCF